MPNPRAAEIRAVPQLALRRCQPTESRELRDWIKARHYTKSAPPGYVVALEFVLAGARVGAMLLGRPTSRELNPAYVQMTRKRIAGPLFADQPSEQPA